MSTALLSSSFASCFGVAAAAGEVVKDETLGEKAGEPMVVECFGIWTLPSLQSIVDCTATHSGLSQYLPNG